MNYQKVGSAHLQNWNGYRWEKSPFLCEVTGAWGTRRRGVGPLVLATAGSPFPYVTAFGFGEGAETKCVDFQVVALGVVGMYGSRESNWARIRGRPGEMYH